MKSYINYSMPLKFAITLLLVGCFIPVLSKSIPKELIGAWEVTMSDGSKASWIITDGYFAIATYKLDEPGFMYTEGGILQVANDGELTFSWEFHTRKPDLVGQQQTHPFTLKDEILNIVSTDWKRVDDGNPGKLNGAWLITGRERNGEMSSRTPGDRKTMKILSGTRFQWIAYNTATGEFSGTGGGTYTTENGKYVENIKFFSRDNTRVGASLEFDFDLQDGKWNHKGLSSRGQPISEIWSDRATL